MKRNFKVFLFVESSRASGRQLLEGIARYAHHHGPWSFYWEPRGLESTSRATLKKFDADGIIFRDVGRFAEEVLRLGIPAVVVGHRSREVRGLINVVTDSARIGQMAAEHLLQCGFKHFAFCGSARSRLEQTPWSELRLESFRRRIIEAGFACPSTHVLSPSGDWQKTRRRLADWLAKLPTPVGVMACNDDCGSQIVEACKLARLAVPDAVGIVGADNDELVCGLSDPPMTSIALNFERAGYASALALEQLMRRSRPRAFHIKVPATHVVARRSTDVVAVEDRSLAKALSFIRDNTRRSIFVDEVAHQAGLSRRVLERRFRAEIGHSVLEEIRRVRTEQIAKLLLETTWPISRIAEALGFEDVQHFARYFRSGKKISPLAFRKLNAAQPTRP
jgi:LacI family transcriptional regulator